MRFLFIILFCSTLLVSAQDVSTEAQKLCSTIRGQNIAHYSIRASLQQFFKTGDSLSEYIVMLYYLMKENKFKDFYVVDCTVNEVRKLSSDAAEVEYKISGHWLLFLTKSITITDRWEKEGERWFIITHEILKKD